MRPITVIRAIAWIGVAVAGTSLMVRWGTDQAVGSGPPAQWEREVVGAALLAGIAAVLLMLPERAGRQRWFTRGLAAAAAAGALWIALVLRSSALGTGFTDLIAGSGWTWLMAGGALSLVAAVASLLLPAKKRKVKVGGKKARRRRKR